MPEFVASGSSLKKTFPDGTIQRRVLDGVDLTLGAGQLVCVQGPSGCGKTTLLSIIAGLLRPDSGSVHIGDVLLDYSKPESVAKVRRNSLGFVSQSYGLIDDESVSANVSLPLQFGSSRVSRLDRYKKVHDALSRAAIDVDPRTKVETLSGGERQRVAIARALVRAPRLLVADEPTAALDRETGLRIVSLLQDVARSGVAVLVATHDAQVVEACDAVYRFEGPRLCLATNLGR